MLKLVYIGVALYISVPPVAPSSVQSRRLIVSGALVEPGSDFLEFTVALMYCRGGASVSKCAAFCSGSLIAPNVILTAAHCLFDRSTGHSTVPLENVYVLVGAANFLRAPRDAQLIKLERAHNAGFGRSVRFPLDDDLAVGVMTSCVDASRFLPVQVSTLASEPTGCVALNTVGYGRHSSVPAELFVHDGSLRWEETHLHSYATCASASNFGPQLAPEKFICSGGDTVPAICNGDSGGPVIVADPGSGRFEQVGISSFGKSSFCGNSPDYSTRVATYAVWIANILDGVRLCRGWSWEESFATWPLVGSGPGSRSETIIGESSGRCPEVYQWMCVSSGECVSMEKLCDAEADCLDGSDETARICRDWSQEAAFIKATIEDEFDKLVGAVNASNSTWEAVGWLEIPQFEFEYFEEASVSSRGGYGFSPGIHCRDPSSVSSDLKAVVETSCSGEVAAVAKFIRDRKAQGGNSVEGASAVCGVLETCVGKPAAQWNKEIDQCNLMNQLSETDRDVVRFCGGLGTFIAQNEAREEFANNFARQYSGTCGLTATTPRPKSIRTTVPRQIAEEDTTSKKANVSASPRFIIYICVLYINLFTKFN